MGNDHAILQTTAMKPMREGGIVEQLKTAISTSRIDGIIDETVLMTELVMIIVSRDQRILNHGIQLGKESVNE